MCRTEGENLKVIAHLLTYQFTPPPVLYHLQTSLSVLGDLLCTSCGTPWSERGTLCTRTGTPWPKTGTHLTVIFEKSKAKICLKIQASCM